MMKKIYPRTGDTQTVYLNAVVKDPSIEVGDYTIYNDFVSNPLLFEQNNVLYHYPINHERLIIGKFCSIACGTSFCSIVQPYIKISINLYIPFVFMRIGIWRNPMFQMHGITKEIS